jgi:16S rRNA (uracil1498-N3)-methyltransferase
VSAPQPLAAWLGTLGERADAEQRCLLGWRGAQPWSATSAATVITLSGPEGGFTADEEALALSRGFVSVSLGARVLRADTAPLAVMAALSLSLASS